MVKCVGLLGLVIAGFVLSPAASASAPRLPNPAHHLFLGLIVALQGVIITYDGWYGPIYFVEEDRDPSRNLPRSMLGSVLCCIAIYLLLNFAYLHVLGMAHLAGSQLPAADSAMLLFGGRGKQFILLISIVSALSAINALLMMTPRVVFAMARDRLLPEGVTAVNRGGTPTVALFLCCLGAILLVMTGTYDSLIAAASILFVAIYISAFVALLVLRSLFCPGLVWGGLGRVLPVGKNQESGLDRWRKELARCQSCSSLAA